MVGFQFIAAKLKLEVMEPSFAASNWVRSANDRSFKFKCKMQILHISLLAAFRQRIQIQIQISNATQRKNKTKLNKNSAAFLRKFKSKNKTKFRAKQRRNFHSSKFASLAAKQQWKRTDFLMDLILLFATFAFLASFLFNLRLEFFVVVVSSSRFSTDRSSSSGFSLGASLRAARVLRNNCEGTSSVQERQKLRFSI